MPQEEESPTTVTCPICGYQSPEGSKRCPHCYSSLETPETKEQTEEAKPESEKRLEELRKIPGVGAAKAETLYEAGFHSLKDIQQASPEKLS